MEFPSCTTDIFFLLVNTIFLADITPISMSTLNERLLIGQNPHSTFTFLPLYTCADLL